MGSTQVGKKKGKPVVLSAVQEQQQKASTGITVAIAATSGPKSVLKKATKLVQTLRGSGGSDDGGFEEQWCQCVS